MRGLAAILIFLSTSAFGQLKTYNIEQIDSLQQAEPRPALVFIHTDWCRYCKAMQNTSFRDSDVINELNEKFYFISFNAESKRKIRIKGAEYKFVPTGTNTGLHQLASTLGTVDGKVDFPTLTFLNEHHEIIYQHSGFLKAKQLLKTLSIIINAKL